MYGKQGLSRVLVSPHHVSQNRPAWGRRDGACFDEAARAEQPMRGTARSPPLGGSISLPPAHHTTQPPVWPLWHAGVVSLHPGGKAALAAVWLGLLVLTRCRLRRRPLRHHHHHVQRPEWRDSAVGLVGSRRCAWIRQFPRASYLGNRASGCFPLASTNPISNGGGPRAVAEVPSSLLRMARSSASLGRAAGLLRHGNVSCHHLLTPSTSGRCRQWPVLGGTGLG